MVGLSRRNGEVSNDRNSLSRRRVVTAAAACGIACLGRPSADAATAEALNELYAKARQEGALNYYAGGPTAPQQATINEFSKSFPGIKFNLATGFSNQLTPRIDDQIARGKMEADVANLQTIQDIERWKHKRALMANRGPNFDQVLEQFKDPDGTSVGVRVYALGYGYNSDQVASDQVPRSALDFLHKQFKGKLVTSYPQDDDITLYLYYTIVQKHGWDFMPALMANQPQLIRGHLGVVQEMAKGRAAMSFDTSVGTALLAKRAGAHVEVVAPTDDLMPVWENRCCIFKDAPHPNAARLFVAWLLSYEHQSSQGLWSTRRDVVPTSGSFKSISSYNTAHDFRDFILDNPRAEDLRKRFATYIGPVRGDPVLGQ